MSTEKERIQRLIRSGLSISEANRWVYGWSDPSMKIFWTEVIKSRPKDSPLFSQKEAFKSVLKTVFGKGLSDDQDVVLEHAAYREIIEVVVRGILAGHVATRSIKNKKPSREDLFHKARSEFKRLLQEDPEFAQFRHEKDKSDE